MSGGEAANGVGNRLTQLFNGGGSGHVIKKRFVELGGGPDANFVIIHVPHSRAAKDERPREVRIASYSDESSARNFGVKQMTALGALERDAADSEEYCAPLKHANAVWITGGNMYALVEPFKGTRAERELGAVLTRGGVIGGESAGAVVQASHIARNIKGAGGAEIDTRFDDGFGFVQRVAVAPHLLRMGWQENLVPVIAANPEILGIGIDEGTAVVVQNGQFEVIGTSKVAIYDNADHDGKRYYFLSPGDRFELAARKLLPREGKSH